MKSWGIYIAVALGIVAFSAMREADRDDTGAIVAEGTVDAFQMRVGDCFNDSSSAPAQGNYEVSDVPGVPCAEPHDNEVYAVFDVSIDSFPEGEAMGELAFESCLERFDAFVGKDYRSSSLDIVTMFPSRESWSRQSDREVVCAVYDMNAAKLTGSAQGAAL